MRVFVLAALAWLGGAASAWPQDNPACAKFEDPLAYNACLARQGPAARPTVRAPTPQAGAASGWAAPPPRGYAPPRGFAPQRGGPLVTRTARGRVHAVFTIR